MDTSGFLIYKCRRCGKIGKFFDAPDGMITLYSLMIDKPLPKEWGRF